MKKHFRKIPETILAKSNSIKNKSQVVSTTIILNETEFDSEIFKNLGLSIKNGELVFSDELIPSSENGKFSKRNALGYTIIRKDLSKVNKTIDCGERPIWGKWENGSFTLFITKKVYQRERMPAKELAIGIELLDTTRVNNSNQYLLKVSVLDILDKESNTFESDMLFNINLLQENIFKADVFSTDAKYDDYLKSYHVDWDFFPPGNREVDVARILSGYKNPSDEIKELIQERYDYLLSLKPKDFIYGLSGIRRYFGARFADNLVVFDNLQYGNAIYVLFEKWEELSKLSRTEIQKRPTNEFVYIKHGNGWKNQLKHVIEKKLAA